MTKGKSQSGRGEMKTLISSAGQSRGITSRRGKRLRPRSAIDTLCCESFHIKSLAFIFFLVKKKKCLWDKWSVGPQVSSQSSAPGAMQRAERRADTLGPSRRRIIYSSNWSIGLLGSRDTCGLVFLPFLLPFFLVFAAANKWVGASSRDLD